MAKHLTKEEELTLGTLVQKSIKAKNLKEIFGEQLFYDLDGEKVSFENINTIIIEGEKSKKKLVEANIGLVHSQASKFKLKYPGAPDLEDLTQEGCTGLIKAVDKYNPERGNKLSTVAYYWINQAITRGTNKTGRLVRLPENRISDYMKINRIRSDFEDSDFTQEEIDSIIMDEMDLTKERFASIISAGNDHYSLNKTMSHDESDGSDEMIDQISNSKSFDKLEEIVSNKLMFESLYQKINNLPEIEKDVIVASFLSSSASQKREAIKKVRAKHSLSLVKFKEVLGESLVNVKKELEKSDISFDDFLD